MSLEYGAAASFTAEFEGPFGSVTGSGVKVAQITLSASAWKGATSPYSQTVNVSGISTNSRIDLYTKDIADFTNTGIYAVNSSGIVTVYAIGTKPSGDITLQACATEIANASGEIVGSAVGCLAPSYSFNGLIKSSGGAAVRAVPGTDYQTPLVAGTDYPVPSAVLFKSGGSMAGYISTKGILLTSGVDYGDALPSTVTPNKLFFVKAATE